MFDCVLPTRSGRHGQAWTWDGPVNMKNARFAEDDSPLDPSSDCPASRDYSKAYLHHLFKAGEILGQVLLSWHNVAFFQSLMEGVRAAIAEGRMEASVAISAPVRSRGRGRRRAWSEPARRRGAAVGCATGAGAGAAGYAQPRSSPRPFR
jgi:queuine/archaeosine tRNA-ribosyltransferase